MPRKIHIDNRLDDIVQMTCEGMQAPHEHSGFYEMPAQYMPQMPTYREPIQPEWFDIPIALTPQPMIHEPFSEPEPKPVEASYEPTSQELFEHLMKQALEQMHAGIFEPLDIREMASVNEILLDYGVEPLRTVDSIPLEESLKEIDDAIFLMQNAPFEMQQMMFEQERQMMMNPFGFGPMM